MQMAESTPTRRPVRLAEIVEKGVEGLFEFLARYLRTIAVVVWVRRNGIHALLRDRRRAPPLYVMPLTYAAIGMFLLSLVTRAAGTNPIDWVWSYEEISKNVFERLTKRSLTRDDCDRGVPALAGVVILSGIQTLFIGCHRRMSRLALFATCYAVGTQSLVLSAVGIGFSIGEFSVSPAMLDRTPKLLSEWIDVAVYILLLGLIAAPLILVPWFLLKALRVRQVWRRGHLRAVGIVIVVLLSTIGGLWLYPVLADIPGRLAAIAAPSTSAAAELVGDIGLGWQNGQIKIVADLQVTNPGTKPLSFPNREVRSQFEAKFFVDGKETKDVLYLEFESAFDLFGRRADFFIVGPGEVWWRRLTFHASLPEKTAFQSLLASTGSSCLEIDIGLGSNKTVTPCVAERIVEIK
jgi:hypothetical protein